MDRDVIRFPLERAAAPLSQRSDDDLMLLASAGRKDAFSVLVERYMDKVTGFCAKLLCDRRAGEEVAQETWLRVWAVRSAYVAQGKFPVYLYTLARNLCRNHRRDRGRRGRWVRDDLDGRACPADEPASLDRLIAREQEARVQEALAALSPRLREAVLLRFSEGLDYPQIAQILGRNESTIRSRVHHGLKRLRDLVQRGSEP
ncbi:MAG TPA: RNA polymerase sigma factor [Kofleriaceae bacterium]|nr:RNA polymerase sigma factor [Kofleriaceae bacterium]